MDDSIFLGGGGPDHRLPQRIALKFANRHGLVAGATGTGKTVTLQIMAEAFSAAGVPVFLADVKGDLSGLAEPGSAEAKPHAAFLARAGQIGLDDYGYDAFPTVFWDLFGQDGHPVRTTVSEMGPLMLARLLELNDTQEGVLNIAFRIADEEGLLLLDLADLRAILAHLAENAKEIGARYGNVSAASVGAIQRRLLVLETQGAAHFLGEPALRLEDLMRTAPDGRGIVNILCAARLMGAPRLYATFLLWLLSELFEELPEVGDPPKPKLVFFFDEAHLLFDGAPKPLIDKVEQVARLIRSKGVGVYFISQNPDDVPDAILGQLGNRVQHALRAFTPRDARALKAAAETFRPNPAFDTAETITALGTGEALVSVLEAKGAPSMVERTLIRPPSSRLGPADPAVLASVRAASPLRGIYDTPVDRESAAELLAARAAAAAAEAERAEAEAATGSAGAARRYGGPNSPGGGGTWAEPAEPRPRARRGDSVGEAFAKSLARSLGSSAGRQILRGVLGSIFRGR